MKILDDSHSQPDHNVLVDNESVRIEQSKLSEDLSTTTITVHAKQEYTFKARSGILQTYVGVGVITSGSETFDLNLFNKVAVNRGERITLKNTQDFPLIINMITAN